MCDIIFVGLSLSSTCQFCLPRAEKELYEREERAETQLEILKKVAKNLPVYTRTAGGGEAFITAPRRPVDHQEKNSA